MNCIFEEFIDDEQELYKHKLGATAALEIKPGSVLQHKYMTSGLSPLMMDPMTAYMRLLDLLGPLEMWTSLFAQEGEGMNDIYYFGDGVSFDVPKKDKKGFVKKENLKSVSRELSLLKLEEREYDERQLDNGELLLDLYSEEKRESTANIVQMLLNDMQEDSRVEQDVITQYIEQVEEQKSSDFCLYEPGVETTVVAEEAAELLDVVNLSHHLGYDKVILPDYLKKKQSVLEQSGLKIQDAFAGPCLTWVGRNAFCEVDVKKEDHVARYVKYFSIRDDELYYPSMLYGRAYSIQFTGYTTSLVPGIVGLKMRDRVRLNLRQMVRTKIEGSVYNVDPYRDFFCKPLKLKGSFDPDFPIDDRRPLQVIRSRESVYKELRCIFFSLNKQQRLDWEDSLRRGMYMPSRLRWIMMVPEVHDLYASVRRIVKRDKHAFDSPFRGSAH